MDDETIRRRLRAVPDSPGVYLFRDQSGQVIYVGKAVRLRSRLRSYFSKAGTDNPRLSELLQRIYDFEFVKAANEVEALVLECNLIKHYRPRYNIRLRDDKNYLYLKLPRNTEFPRVHYTRRLADDGARYFGPYTSSQSLRSTVKSLRRLFPFRTCSDEVFRQGRVCLDYHIQRCPGPCERRISAQDYQARLEEVALFLEGRSDSLVAELEQRMTVAADNLDFENAAHYRDQLQAVEKIGDRQKVSVQRGDDQDLIAYASNGRDVFVEVAYIRQGKMVGHDGHSLEGAASADEAEILRGFLLQYYGQATHIPKSVLLPGPVAEAEAMAAWLTQRRGSGVVRVEVPQRGRKSALIQQLMETATEELEQLRIRAEYDRSRTEPMLIALADALDLSELPLRIECYDISNLQGEAAVGSMVVFQDGRPSPDNYRIFKIRKTQGPNDFAMLQEVLRRRFEKLEELLRRGGGEVADASFSKRPDLIIIDGGKGQLSAVMEVLEELGFADIPTFGLAKEREELFAPGRSEPIVQEHNSPGMFLVQQIRDEAHRFAITRHRKARNRQALSSPLDSVEGIGPARKRKLLRTLGGLEGVRAAPLSEIVKLGIPETVALRVKELL